MNVHVRVGLDVCLTLILTLVRVVLVPRPKL